jgi:hypothetical protein
MIAALNKQTNIQSKTQYKDILYYITPHPTTQNEMARYLKNSIQDIQKLNPQLSYQIPYQTAIAYYKI